MVRNVVRRADTVILSGQAASDAIVRLSSPEGQSWGVTAAPDGTFTFSLNLGAAPRMFALTSEQSDRLARSDGAVLLLPAPAVSGVLARAGFGALALDPATERPVIVAIDFDQGGGAMVSGLVRQGTGVRLLVDEAPAGESRSDSLGRFVIASTGRPLRAGLHRLRVEASTGQAIVDATIAASALPRTKIYAASRQEGGWRIDWRTAGGGVQTTLVLDSAAEALRSSASQGGRG